MFQKFYKNGSCPKCNTKINGVFEEMKSIRKSVLRLFFPEKKR